MNILVDARLLSRGGNSGVEEYARCLLSEIIYQAAGDDFTFFYNGLRKADLASQIEGIDSRNVRILNWRIPNKFLDASSRLFSFPKLDKIIKTDLIYSPHFNLLANGGAPRIITIPDLSFMHHPHFFSLRQRFWHRLQDIKKQAVSADKIITVSEFTKGDIVELLGVAPEKVKVIYPGISKIFHGGQQLQTKQPYILYLGTIEPRKNINLLIRAFNIVKKEPDLSNLQLVIAGRLGWLYDEVLKEARMSPYAEDIIFRGGVGSSERVSLYNSAKAFIYPSFFEGFGFPPLEAQASGCPVIVSDRTSLPEVLGDSALYTDPWKVEDLAGQIMRIAQDTNLRRELIAKGAINVKKFDWKNSAADTIKLFHS